MSRRERRLQAKRLSGEPSARTQQARAPASPLARFFDTHYHKLQLIPLFILLLAIGYNVWFYQTHGDFVKKGVSLAGGTSVTVTTTDRIDQRALEENLATTFPGASFTTRILGTAASHRGFTVDASGLADATGDGLAKYLRDAYPTSSVSVETTGSSLGASFFRQTVLAILVAFVLMGIVVFVSFRTFYPSIAVILAGFSTVVSTLAVFNLMGFALSTAGVAAFLMLIGYSIDTDVLLSTRVLRREGTFIANVWSAAKTGLTMQITTTITVAIVLIFSNNAVFDQIMIIILIGMFFDVLYTWIQNAAILKWYFENKAKHLREAPSGGEKA